ncbi:TetR/AcrR family transcriptional regulator [Calycomorphotria hydatis]|uniref:HTH-type transcriptional regulator SrpR n=1 Tax=Calycomorphotria hydatis TaxID=2528027 RepID=A0A517TDR8_9PLAN|nr:TetR/AcrR family transcriptional regulator [Calycomorphotria hydatis]QDT66514.1 HTH-type transcriptional regulator SrpR [Calycomorphotria hydatis]
MDSKHPSLTEQKRRAILDAALQEFGTSGFQATSMDQVAARANVSKRTVYNHFCSKKGLFDAIRSDLFCKIASIQCEYDDDASLEEQLESIARQQVEILCSAAFLSFARISIPLSLCTKDSTTYHEFHAANKAILDWIKQASRAGRLRVENPNFVAKQFVGLLSDGIFWPQLLGGQPSPSKSQRKKIIDASVRMFLSAYSAKS